MLADLPATDYDIITLQGSLGRKTVHLKSKQRVEQGIFSISSNRGASGHLNLASSLPIAVTEDGFCSGFQLLYSGNFEVVQKNQLKFRWTGDQSKTSLELEPNQGFITPVYDTTPIKGLTGLQSRESSICPKPYHSKRICP